MIHRMILSLVAFCFFVLMGTGCSAEIAPTPTVVTAVAEVSQSTSTPSPTETAIASPTMTSTPTFTPSPTELPTLTPSPMASPTMTPTPNPLADLPGYIVFSSYQGSDNAEIYIMSIDGSELKRLTDDDFFDFTPQPSPDGQKIAFSSDRDGSLQIYTMDVDGNNLTRITNSEGNDRDPSWSPDGTQLVFASDKLGDPEIYVINLDGSGERQLTNNDTSDVSPIWSPDGAWIAYSSSQEADDPNIFVMAPDGSGQRRLTFSGSYDGDAATWSPDSQWLILPAKRIGNYELYGLKMDGSEFGTLTRTEGDEYSGLLSADGRYMLLNAYYDDFNGVILRDLETQSDYQLTATDSSASYAAWMPTTEVTFDEHWIVNSLGSDDDVCIYAEDETYGFTAENPMPIGNGQSFGGPFDGVDAYSFLRVTPGEAREWIRGHTFPTNSKNDTLDTLIITAEGGQMVELYVNINDYSIPQIPVGMFCDLQLP